jgi:hypothetical protein
MIIGLAGYSGSGKDTFADLLVEHENFIKVAFADQMRSALYALNPLIKSESSDDLFCLKDLVDDIGWDFAKRQFSEVRSLLQKMGTEVGRNIIDEYVWVDALFKQYKKNPEVNLVIPDVRFSNEACEIWARGGHVIRVVRPDTHPVNSHISEIAFTQQDLIIRNDGKPIEMLFKYRNYFERS